MPDLTATQWLLVAFTAFCVGFSKMGLVGIIMLVIPVMAVVFGARESTGIMLPILIVGDITAVAYYRKHAQWRDLLRLLPWALAGLLVGSYVGGMVDDTLFRQILAGSVMLCVAGLVYTEIKQGKLNLPRKMWFYALMGMAAGFVTMIGHAAGPLMSVYLLAMGYKKEGFVGTYAWFFLIINLTKVPFQVFLWNNLTWDTVALAAFVIPAVILGAFCGVMTVKRINDKPFRYVIMATTALAAVRLFF